MLVALPISTVVAGPVPGAAIAPAAAVSIPTSLEHAITEAIASNTEIVAAMRRVDVARAQRRGIALAPLQLQPSLALTPDVPGGIGSLQTASAIVSQSFVQVGFLAASRASADASIRAAEYGIDVAKRDLALRVVSAYFAVAGAQATIDVDRTNVAASQEFVATASARERAGSIGAFEVTRATIELRRVQADLARATATRDETRAALNTLLGREPGTVTDVIGARIGDTTRNPEIARDTGASALASDPATMQFDAQIAAQRERARASATARKPALTLGVGYQITRGTRTNAIFGAPVVTGGFAIPLFDRGSIAGAVAEANAEANVLEAQRTGRARVVHADLAAALATIASARDRLAFATTTREQADAALRVAQYGFRRGALSALDVLAAKNAAAIARGDERQVANDLAGGRARLHVLLGVPRSS